VVLDDLMAAVDGTAVSTVCEVGCADGQFSCELARRLGPASRARMVGLDIADQVLRRYPFARLCSSAFQMPLKTGAVDVLCYAASLHHLAPFGAALAEMDRVLAPGGLVYFLEPNRLHPQRRLFMGHPALYRLYRDADDTPVDPYALRAELHRLGFDVPVLRFITIAFREPGLLQRLQNWLAAVPWPAPLRPYVSPWFVLIARRRRR
jgi:SAM-dependent methyltransferase